MHLQLTQQFDQSVLVDKEGFLKKHLEELFYFLQGY